MTHLDRSSGAARIWLCASSTDMRCGFDRLAQLAQSITGQDPLSGHLFIFRKGLAGPGLLAYVITSKYSDYLSLYRLEDIFARNGFEIARSTLSLWSRDTAEIVLNRKNSLFVGNPRGGETTAILSCFTSTAKRHDIDPQLYFTQLLANLPASPISKLESWLPDLWKQRQSTSTD